MLYRDIVFLSVAAIFKKFYFEKLFGTEFLNVIFHCEKVLRNSMLREIIHSSRNITSCIKVGVFMTYRGQRYALKG